MKKLENLLLKASGYTIITVILFYLVAMMGEFTKAALDFKTFMLIFVFGIIISAVNLIFEIQILHKALKILIHYAVLLVSFFVIFFVAGKLGNAATSVIFSAIIVFTALYAVIFVITYLIKKAVTSADRVIDKSGTKRKEKKNYTPLYKSKD
jgi:prepilin signal peptidase PulO-like enzyme (type II secretory pathway)